MGYDFTFFVCRTLLGVVDWTIVGRRTVARHPLASLLNLKALAGLLCLLIGRRVVGVICVAVCDLGLTLVVVGLVTGLFLGR